MKREELYESPQVEILELEPEQVLLAASGGPQFSPFGPEDDWN